MSRTQIITQVRDGADARKVCRPGITAWVVAKEHGYTAISELLKRAMDQSRRAKFDTPSYSVGRRAESEALSATK